MKTDIRTAAVSLYFLPVQTRHASEVWARNVDPSDLRRAKVTVRDLAGRAADGWGETPLSVQWFWPSPSSYETRHAALTDFCRLVARAWVEQRTAGHPIELGHDFQQAILPGLVRQFNAGRTVDPLPYLAALGVTSVIDQALHDAYGNLHGVDCYQTYNSQWMSRDLAHFLQPAEASDASFAGRFPQEFLAAKPPRQIPAWHLVGGLDPLEPADLTGSEPDDGYPVLLSDWIRTRWPELPEGQAARQR